MQIRNITEEYAGYLRDESRSVGTAEHIAFPADAAQVREAVLSAYAAGERITVQGARTGLAGGASPRGGLILNMSRMNKALSMRKDEDTYYITVQPGLALSELRKMLSSKRIDTSGWDDAAKGVYNDFCRDREFFFSPDPTETSASIGGMVSCNASGARSYMYGATRKYVSGIGMVLADGRILHIERGVRADGYLARFVCDDGSIVEARVPAYRMPDTKNASGYFAEKDAELIDLIVGSDGTLGVFTEIELKLLPQPEYIWGASQMFSDERKALSFIDSLRRQVKGIASIEYFDVGALEILREQKKSNPAFADLTDIPEDVTAVVYAELHARSEAGAYEKLFAIGDIYTAAGGDEGRSLVARNANDMDRLMFFRHAVPESVNMMIDRRKAENPVITKMGSDMSVPDDRLFDVMDMYRADIRKNGLRSAIWGHGGNNHFHVNIIPENEEQYLTTKAMFRQWAANVTAMGGAVSAEHGVGKLKADFLEIMYGPEAISQMRKFKRAFDPRTLLGVGNMFAEEK